MKKFLGVMALGLSLAAAGTTASLAQTTGGAGGAGAPGNGTSGAMSQPEAGSSMSQPTGSDAMKSQMQKEKSPASTNAGAAQEK